VFFLPKLVVAAINGHAIAGGCVLTCCADRRLMARGVGRIGVTELLVGVPFPALAFEIVRAGVPARHLVEFTLGGATYDAAEALALGWVDKITLAAARRLASLSPFAFAQTKTQMRQPVVERLERSGAAIDKIAIENWHLRRRSATSATMSRAR
jgi:enoyl-CoA hydratase